MSNQNNRFSVQSVQRTDLAPISFGLFLLLGVALVAGSKLSDFPLWAVIGSPVLVMVGYLLCALYLPRFELRRDQLGDNLYYLGFLLTLVSLTVTLIQYSDNRDDDYIVSNFGVALVATILGITLRTLLGQMRKDSASVERDMQASLSEASSRLRGQMSNSLEDFATLNRTMEQITRESAVNIRHAHEALAQGLAESVDEVTSALAAQVEQSRDSVESETSLFTQAIEARTESISSNITAVTHRLVDAIGSHAESITIATERNAKALTSIEEIKIDTSNLQEVREAIKVFGELTIEKLMENTESNIGIVEKNRDSIASLNEVIDELQMKLAKLALDIQKSDDTPKPFGKSTDAPRGAVVNQNSDWELDLFDSFDDEFDGKPRGNDKEIKYS